MKENDIEKANRAKKDGARSKYHGATRITDSDARYI